MVYSFKSTLNMSFLRYVFFFSRMSVSLTVKQYKLPMNDQSKYWNLEAGQHDNIEESLHFLIKENNIIKALSVIFPYF